MQIDNRSGTLMKYSFLTAEEVNLMVNDIHLHMGSFVDFLQCNGTSYPVGS